MSPLASIAGLLVVAAITPGPNNLIVLRAATRSGIIGALPGIAGVVTGGLVLLAVVVAGAGALFAAEPRLRLAITAGGCAWLGWLGVGLIMRHRASVGASGPSTRRTSRASFASLFAFQFLNPKGWLMLLTVVSTMTTLSMPRTFAVIAALFVPVSMGCLFLWALFGTRLAGWLMQAKARLWFDRTAGCLLLAMAALLLLDTWPRGF